MTYEVYIEYPDGCKETRIFDDQTNCKCTTSKFIRDLVKAEQFSKVIIDRK